MFDFEITVENIVMTGSFSECVDLSVANQKLEGSKRNWKQLSGLSFKLKKPSATFLLFQNGKFICTNIKTETKANQALTKLLNILKTEKLVSNDCTFEGYVKNLVASMNLSSATISPEQFTNDFEAIYDPTKCPTPHNHKTDQPQANFIVFLTGKLICTGATNKNELKESVKKFYEQLKEQNVIQQKLTIN
jgi:transcription initiation factor TFIID TATA-box-binding protein